MQSLRRLAAAAAAGIGLGLLGTVPASAHTWTDWYEDTWNIDTRVYWFSTRFPTGTNIRARTVEAGDAWEALSGTLQFNLGAGADRPPWPGTPEGTDCDDQLSYDVIDWVPLPSTTYGITTTCLVNGTFSLRMNDTLPWYTGTGQNPSNQVHFRGAIKHEFGHATGGWLVAHWNQPPNADPSLCVSGSWMSYHTMCKGITEAQTWRWNTLETHDKHTFQAAYP